MPPRLPLRASAAQGLLRPSKPNQTSAVCFFCSLSSPSKHAPTRGARRKTNSSRRLQSSSAKSHVAPESDARKELEYALLQLEKHAANFVNLPRLQLAINGLRQQPGSESIRVAILGLSNRDGTTASEAAKQLLKLLLADPLKDPEEWEEQIDRHDPAQPMIVRVGAEERREPGTISLTRENLLHEVNVSSATLNGHNLELLLMNKMDTHPYVTPVEVGVEGVEDANLVPTVHIPISSTGRYTPISTPVHKALIVADGIMGLGSVAASVGEMPLSSTDVLASAVNVPEYKSNDDLNLPFTLIDVGTAGVGLGLIRTSLNDAMKYEHMWFQSNIPKVADWVKADIMRTSTGTTKPPVRRLIASLLQNATDAIDIERDKAQHSSSLVEIAHSKPERNLESSLAAWAESAHTELQEQLDLAFSSRRWRKLGWWKLFWRVDDVHMLTTDILNQRFLPASEKNAIYLAGRIKEASAASDLPIVYESPTLTSTNAKLPFPTTWPMNIPSARSHLQNETIPALQALAQKLVLQTLSTSGLTTSIGALAYFGTLTTGIYEAGAVAALGIVWSLRQMQKKWETARDFWEGEVREEGRKAVRGVEQSVEKVIKQSHRADPGPITEAEELVEARRLVAHATDALSRLK